MSLEITGTLKITPEPNESIKNLLQGLNRTRRMARDIGKLAELNNISPVMAERLYGKEGELYYEDFPNSDQTRDPSIIDYNRPPGNQPSLWNNWILDPETSTLSWEPHDKFYNYREWLTYIIDDILAPDGYKVNGYIKWVGDEHPLDRGYTCVNNNIIIDRLSL